MTHPLYYTILGKEVSWCAHGLLEVCECMHGSIVGSGDRMHPELAVEYKEWLEHRLQSWYLDRTRFDAAVRELCIASLEEYKKTHFEEDLQYLNGRDPPE